MKRQYIKPETEIVHTQGLLAGDDYNINTNSIDSGTDADARESDIFLEEDSRGRGFGYRRYNLWED